MFRPGLGVEKILNSKTGLQNSVRKYGCCDMAGYGDEKAMIFGTLWLILSAHDGADWVASRSGLQSRVWSGARDIGIIESDDLANFVTLFTCWFYLDNNSPNPNMQNHNSINQRCHWISRTSWGLTWSDKNSFYKKTFRMGISLDYMTRCVCAPDQSKVNVKLKKRTFLNFRFLSFATFYHIIGVFNCRPVETMGAAFILFRTHRYKPISKCYLLL